MSGRTVLLVEDSGFMANHVAETLESTHDMRVRIAADAGEARGLLAGSDPEFDCLVVNSQLPDENGIEFVEAIREDADLPSPPSLLFTGELLEDVATKAFDAGIVGVVSKAHHAGDSMDVFANRIDLAVDAHRYRQQ